MASALFALALAYARDARAGEDVSNEVFSSGVSFENLTVGDFNPRMSDFGSDQGPYHWYSTVTSDLGQVSAYAPGAAYDYAAHGLERNKYLEEYEPLAYNYLTVNSEVNLHRAIFSRDLPDEGFTNLLVRTATRESIYCDVLTQLSPCEAAPPFESSARIAVWVRLAETSEGLATNLMVTAGAYTNNFTAVTVRDYVLDVSNVCSNGLDLTKWYRLTVRAHGDVSAQGVGLGCFSVYLDGKPLRAAADGYRISDDREIGRISLAPEARALVAERRLFPSMAKPGSDKALTVSGFTFTGSGLVDDISFSSEDPGYAKAESVFTLSWDAGVTKLEYTLDGGLTTNAAPLATARSVDLLLGSSATNGLTLKVLKVAYDTENGYGPGTWLGSNGVTLTNDVEFVFDGSTRNPIAAVAATRDAIDVGPGGYETFASAFAALDQKTNAVKTLTLNDDIVVPVMKPSERDAYGNRDEGFVSVQNPEGEYVLDLCGHTLRGAGRSATVVVSCKSLRIIDSSLEKTGRILPRLSHTNASERLNTAVSVEPQVRKGVIVEPVLTIQGGTYDGWVRNGVNTDATGDSAYTGVIYIEGGSYISTNAASFYLESYVTNLTAQFVYREGYWSCLATNAFIWTGLGDGRRWVDPENWKSHAVPGSDDTALFPCRAEGLPPWTVDVGDHQMTTKKLWLEGDVFLSGTNDFLDVTLKADGLGRICGDATLEFEGDQPGSLTETTLRDDFAGTVVLRNIGYSSSKTKVPKVLKAMETWGTADSTVVFHGVRGYVQDVSTHTMPYDLVLRDYVYTKAGGSVVTNAAWMNDSGYTGSTLAFTGALLGDGTFSSTYNLRAVLQLIKFADVEDFTGRLAVNGKRVLIGQEMALPTIPGLIAFGNYAYVHSDLGWTCRNAVFATYLNVLGTTNDVLVTATAAEPVATNCVITLNKQPNVASLATTNQPKWSVYISGTVPDFYASYTATPVAPPEEGGALSVASSPSVFLALASAIASGSSYSVAALRSAATTQAGVAVEEADLSIEVAEDEVILNVSNTERGLWYGVRYRASLSDEWTSPGVEEWRQATGETVTLSCPRQSDAGFYGVVVRIDDPKTGGGAQ